MHLLILIPFSMPMSLSPSPDDILIYWKTYDILRSMVFDGDKDSFISLWYSWKLWKSKPKEPKRKSVEHHQHNRHVRVSYCPAKPTKLVEYVGRVFLRTFGVGSNFAFHRTLLGGEPATSEGFPTWAFEEIQWENEDQVELCLEVPSFFRQIWCFYSRRYCPCPSIPARP